MTALQADREYRTGEFIRHVEINKIRITFIYNKL